MTIFILHFSDDHPLSCLVYIISEHSTNILSVAHFVQPYKTQIHLSDVIIHIKKATGRENDSKNAIND